MNQEPYYKKLDFEVYKPNEVRTWRRYDPKIPNRRLLSDQCFTG